MMNESKMGFEVVPVAEVLQKAQPLREEDIAAEGAGVAGPQRGPAQQAWPLQQSGERAAMKRRIFVVDDEKVIADSLCAILCGSGYDAVALYDGETSLRACRDRRPDFVISDVCMPGMSGVDMAIQFKERYPSCGVLLFSGQAGTSELLADAHRRGYEFELLMKPVHPRDLLAKVDLSCPRPPSFESNGNVSRPMAV